MRSLCLLLTLGLLACGDDLRPTSSDAGLPSCASVGCPTVAFCKRGGTCVCVPPSGGSGVECVLGAPDAMP